MPKPSRTWLFHAYLVSQELAAKDHPFYALIMAAMRKADTDNTAKLKAAWPEVWKELMLRYHAPGGALTSNEVAYISKQKGGD